MSAESIQRVSRDPQGKCAECGKPLRPNIHGVFERREIEITNPAVGLLKAEKTWTDIHSVQVGEEIRGYGYMGQGGFCTLRCGWRFGLRVIRNDDQRRADKGEK